MIDDKMIRALVEYDGAPALSLYLDTDLVHRTKDAVRLLFRERTKDVASEAPDEIERIGNYLDFEYDWRARGLAIFASGESLWETIPLPIPVSTRAFYGAKPYLRVLTDVRDRFGQYSVALVDRESVRVFSIAGGSAQLEAELVGEELKRHKQGGWAASRLQRHENNLALQNLKQAVRVIQDYCQEAHCKRLMLAGSTDVVSQIKDLLPNDLRGRLIGEFAADADASPSEILNRSLDIAAQADWAEEQELVALAITEAAKGGQGVTGLPDTLYELHQGRVHQLLVAEEYRAPGYVCDHCGYVAAQEFAVCPLCSHEKISETADVVNLAIFKAAETGAAVNIVRENDKLVEAGGIAAVLRY
jgi:peptide subunit release factor 1 (eRF1)